MRSRVRPFRKSQVSIPCIRHPQGPGLRPEDLEHPHLLKEGEDVLGGHPLSCFRLEESTTKVPKACISGGWAVAEEVLRSLLPPAAEPTFCYLFQSHLIQMVPERAMPSEDSTKIGKI
ncbi:unnamed protein product [Nesidiocoris tenuis]|uniref:Uncharacterized protein n=1 Tax=Nesidiocoris tenuis TaxID=355587 RepID=A0A6H5HVR1_9HEMI|nr:unnamed protein product [Nesidiocoris tenuis]